MRFLEQAKVELRRQLQAHSFTAAQEIAMATIETTMSIDLLPWLKAQTNYPQFYFNFREQPRKIAAIGKVRSFFDINSLKQALAEYSIPIFGGLQFHGSAHFYIPQILVEQGEGTVKISAFSDVVQLAQVLAQLETLDKTTALQPLVKQSDLNKRQKADQATWCAWVEQALVKIKQGTLIKVVLANETEFQLTQSVNAKDFLAASEKQNQGCYHFLWAENAQLSFVGSTPERLFQRCNNQLTTEALAGTAAVTDDELINRQQADWLLNDRKNLNENWLVVKDILHNIKTFTEQIQIQGIALKPLRKVQHLVRHIQALLKSGVSDADLLQAIHPTAAVSGLPQQAAKQALAEIEQFDRHWYAGTLGIITKEEAEFCVTIRSAFIESNRIRIFAGAGIVEESDPLTEWREIDRKALGLVSLLQDEGEAK